MSPVTDSNTSTTPSADAIGRVVPNSSRPLANGETATVTLRQLDVVAMLLIDRRVHPELPQAVIDRIKTYFDKVTLELCIIDPDEVVKFDMDCLMAHWDGRVIECDLEEVHHGLVVNMPLRFKAEVDMDELLKRSPGFKPQQPQNTEEETDAAGTRDGDSTGVAPGENFAE